MGVIQHLVYKRPEAVEIDTAWFPSFLFPILAGSPPVCFVVVFGMRDTRDESEPPE